MSAKTGLWIDHRHAFIVHLVGETATSEMIYSNLEKQTKTTGGSRTSSPYGPQDVVAEDRLERKVQQHLEQYYEKVAQSLRGAETIFIFGPGMAKDELKKHLDKSKQKTRPYTTLETSDKMTDGQIIARVKKHFLSSSLMSG